MSFADSVHALVHDGTAMWGFLTAAGLVLLLTPLVARLAPLVRGVDDKGDRPRVHGGSPIPRIGGPRVVRGLAGSLVCFLTTAGRHPRTPLSTLTASRPTLPRPPKRLAPRLPTAG